ncbi:MAG: class I adenylate-forming enzyme family protein [Paracoccaceae bacterium]
MSALADQLAPRAEDEPLVMAGAAPLTARAARSVRADDAFGSAAKVALCLTAPDALIRALLAFDGRVGALLLLSPSLPAETATRLAEAAGCSDLVTDRAELAGGPIRTRALSAALAPDCLADAPRPSRETLWLMTTSGTTGTPKIVPHTLRSLSHSVYRFAARAVPNWGLLYDPTRFAGLQVVLQALIGGGRLIAPDPAAGLGAQIETLAAARCTHLSATPTLWRRILMAPESARLALGQITLGGEIVDQAVLNALADRFPRARITHIYASTEAGVGFSVNDGRAGFPADYVGDTATGPQTAGGLRLRIADDVLWVRPPVAGPTVAGATADGPVERDAEGFVRTGDRVRREGARILFLGRESGLINVGGVKIMPESVEAVIRSVPGVAQVQVGAKKNPLTGALVTAAVQLGPDADPTETKRRILETCRTRLEREAVPASVRFVDGFEVNAAGKLLRRSVT